MIMFQIKTIQDFVLNQTTFARRSFVKQKKFKTNYGDKFFQLIHQGCPLIFKIALKIISHRLGIKAIFDKFRLLIFFF